MIAAIILTVAFSMSELDLRVSRPPGARTGGRTELGGTGWSWFTGWFNVIGLFAIVATVDWFCAFFATYVFGLWGVDFGIVNFADDGTSLAEIFMVFVLILVLHAMINIFSRHLVALFNNISVFWHVSGRRSSSGC